MSTPGESDEHVFELAGAGLHQGAPAAHVRARAGDERNRRHAAGDRRFQLVVVRTDDVEHAQLGIGLVDHFVDVAGTADVAVGFNQAGHGEFVALIDFGVAGRHGDLGPRSDRLNFAVGHQDRRVDDRLTGAGDRLGHVDGQLRLFGGAGGGRHPTGDKQCNQGANTPRSPD